LASASIVMPQTGTAVTRVASARDETGPSGSGSGVVNLSCPNLPPTASTVASFRELLLRRLGLIKKAGGYNLITL
jgi:hypothetical protein